MWTQNRKYPLFVYEFHDFTFFIVQGASTVSLRVYSAIHYPVEKSMGQFSCHPLANHLMLGNASFSQMRNGYLCGRKRNYGEVAR